MKRFVPLLRKINEKLDLPQPIKSRIILEMAADLDDLYETYRSKGLNEEEAVQKTEEKFDASAETLAELANVHTTGFRKFLDKISQRSQVTWERIFLVFIIIAITINSFYTIFETSFLQNSSKFVYPISVFFLVILGIIISKFYQLYIKKDHRLQKLRTGINSILYLGLLNILIGSLGYIFEILSSGAQGIMFVPFLLILIDTSPPEAVLMLNDIIGTMIRSTSLMMVCILVTMITALFWFGFMNMIAKIEYAEAIFLLED